MSYINNSWSSIEEMFNALHKNDVKYLILRNYEEIDEDNFYTSGHADIDFLTDDCKKFSETINARPRFQTNDNIHFLVNIKDVAVVLDVRSVGDGYYDKVWQKSMLNNRILKDGRFYIMDSNNYYRSLIYHAILQKESYAEDYNLRLNKMAEDLNISATGKEAHLSQLKEFMKSNNYCFTVPYDIWVPFKREYLTNETVFISSKVKMRNLKQSFLSFGSKVKHKISGK